MSWWEYNRNWMFVVAAIIVILIVVALVGRQG